jgi:hypothetical protein
MESRSTAMDGLRLSGLADGTFEWAELDGLAGRVDDAAAVVDGVVGAAVPLASILAGTEIDPAATYCTVVSRDGAYSASVPIDDLRQGGWLAYALDGEPLADDLGGPLRLTVARGNTLCWNVKDVGELRFTAGKEPDSVPERPTH